MQQAQTAASQPDGAVTVTVAAILKEVHVGAQSASGHLTMFPLVRAACAPPSYVVLDEALAAGTAHVTEVSDAGSVPDLKFANEGEIPILLLDGEELAGAKQNRVLNLSILVPARATLVIPVSCVEAGRWRARSREFGSSPSPLFASSRAKKTSQVHRSLRVSGLRSSDQSEVWADVDAMARRLATHSPTAAMSDIFTRHAASVEEFTTALRPEGNQVGALFAIAGEVVGLDLFDCPETLAKLLPKLVRSYALDALSAEPSQTAILSPGAVLEFLDAVGRCACESFPAVGEGVDIRLEGSGAVGAALVAGGKVVHLSAFAVTGRQHSENGVLPRMIRASARRRHHERPPEENPD